MTIELLKLKLAMKEGAYLLALDNNWPEVGKKEIELIKAHEALKTALKEGR